MNKSEFIEVVTILQNFDTECYRWEKFGIPLWDLPVREIALCFVDIYLKNNFTASKINEFWENYDVLTPEALWILLTNQSSDE